MNQHCETICSTDHAYAIEVGGAFDGAMTRDPVGYGAYNQAWENNLWVRMENTGTEAVQNPWLHRADRPNWRSREDIVADLLTPEMDAAERARAIWEFARRHRYHRTTADDEVKDTVKMLNAYGYTLCWDEAYTVANLWQQAGLKIRRGVPHGHCTTEVFFDGAYHLLDSDEHLLYLLRDNQTIASEEDLARDHDLVKRGHAYGILSPESRRTSEQAASLFVHTGPRGGGRPVVGDHRMDCVLRPGEALVWSWADRGKYHGRGERPPRLCNGQWSFTPRLDAEFKRWTETAANLQYTPDGLAPTDAAQPTSVTYRIASPYPIVGGQLNLDGEASVELLRDGAWQPVRGGDLDPHFSSASPACYAYALRLSDLGLLRGLTIDSDLQMAPLSLPALTIGTNAFRYADASDARRIQITHAWQERTDRQPPAAPAQAQFPPDSATAAGTHFSFRWTPVPDAADYHFELSPRADMRYALSPVFEKLISKTPAAGRAEWTLPEEGLLNPGQTYYWRVRARSGEGLWGAWSPVWSFTPRAPGIPLDLALDADWDARTLTLHWRPNPAGEDAVHYEVHASNERGFSARREPYPLYKGGDKEEIAPANLIATTTDTRLQVVGAELAAGNRAFYRVVAVDAAGHRSGPSEYAEAPRPFIYSKPPTRAIAGRETVYPVQSLRSIGDLRSESDGPKRYLSAFRDGDQFRYLLDEGPAFIHLDADTGLLTATPGREHLGFHTITFRVHNGPGSVDLQGFDLEVVAD